MDDEYTYGCGYTQDYADEPHGIICFHVNGENGSLIDVDEFHDGFDPSNAYPPCPNCNWSLFEKELREEHFNSDPHPSEQKLRSLTFQWRNSVKQRMQCQQPKA